MNRRTGLLALGHEVRQGHLVPVVDARWRIRCVEVL